MRERRERWQYTEYGVVCWEYGVVCWPVDAAEADPAPQPQSPAQPNRVVAERLDRSEPVRLPAGEPSREIVRRPVEPADYEENGYDFVDGTITAADPDPPPGVAYYLIPYVVTQEF